MNEKTEFIKEGMTRFKQAHDIYWTFRDEIRNTLHSILQERQEWGNFFPDKDRISSSIWIKGLIQGARLPCKYSDKIFFIGIGLDWHYDIQKKDFPVYFLWLEDEKHNYVRLNEDFLYSKNIKYKGKSNYKHMVLYPNQDKIDFEGEFNLLLDDFFNSMKEFQLMN